MKCRPQRATIIFPGWEAALEAKRTLVALLADSGGVQYKAVGRRPPSRANESMLLLVGSVILAR